MITETKPLMLETKKGEFINANKIYTVEKNGRAFYEGTPDGIGTAVLTDKSMNLLTNSSTKGKSLDIEA